MNINRDKHNKYVVNGVYGPSTSGSTDTGGSTGSSSSTSSGSNTGSSSSGIGGGNYGGNGGGSSVISVQKNAFTIFQTSDGVNTIVQTATSEESTASIDFAGDDVIKVTIAAQSSIPESEFTSTTGESVYKISYGKQTVEEETQWVLELEYVSGTQLKPSDFDALKLFSVESEEEGSFSEVASFPSSELTIETITKEVSVGVTEDRVTKISVDCDQLQFTQVSLTLTVEDTYSTVLSFNTSISNKTITQFIADLSDYATKVYVQEQIDALVGAAPDILDTLYELANALGNDPNFATTITNMITGIDNRVDVVEADIETLKEQLGNISVDDAIANYLTTNNYAKKSDITWGNLLDKPSVFNTNIANISDLHSSWDALLKAQKPTTLASYGIADGVNAVNVTGSGNVVTSASVSGHMLTLTKGVNALTTVSLATISDLHSSWDALLKSAPSAYVTRWPTAAEVGALTQATGDGRYALKSGTNATGTWPISITGNAATATKLALQDTRSVNTAPFANGQGLIYHFKYNRADGLSDGGTYHSVLQFDQWIDPSGGLCKQLALTDGGNMWFRNASSATAWGAWKKLLDSSNYASTLDTRYVKKAGDTMTGALTVPSLVVSGSTATVSGNKVWHAGNDGSGSGLDADLLDGQHGSSYLRSFWTNSPGYDANTYPSSSFCTFTYSRNAPYVGVLAYLGTSYGIYLNLAYNTGTSTGPIAYRKVSPSNDGGGLGAWAYLARTTDNVASATKLQTARSIWGQSFNGTANVSGNMTGVGSISASGNIMTDNALFQIDATNLSGDRGLNVLYNGQRVLCGFGTSGNKGLYITHSGSSPGWVLSVPSLTVVAIAQNSGVKVGIGTTSPSYKLHVAGTGYFSGALTTASGINVEGTGVKEYLKNSSYAGDVIIGGSYTSTYGNYIYFVPPDTNSIRVTSLTLCSAGSYTVRMGGDVYVTGRVTQASDIRLKTNISNLLYRGRLNPKTFIRDNKQQIGFIAQDVQKLYPEVVIEDNDENHYLSLSYSNMTAILSAQINYVEDEVSLLKKKIQELETRLSKYEDVK